MADDTDIFAEGIRPRSQLLEQLAAASISEVIAVVGPSGPAAGRFQDDELWTMTFTADAWRVNGGEIETRPLTLRREVNDDEFKTYQKLIAPYGVIRVKARVVVDPALGDPQALLEAFVGRVSSDAELNRHAEELQRPVTFEDPILGSFTLDRRIDWFTAKAIWAGKTITLNLSGSADSQAALGTAYALWENQSEWNRRLRDFAAKELLPTAWIDEEEAELTPDEFKARMTLESITVYADGSFDFWHDDGDLFWGHSIQVSGSLSEGPDRANIAG